MFISYCNVYQLKYTNGMTNTKFSLFQQIVTDLRASGLMQQRIADTCACSQPNIMRLEQEADLNPRWSTGQALIQLHARTCSDSKVKAVQRLIKDNPARRRRLRL